MQFYLVPCMQLHNSRLTFNSFSNFVILVSRCSLSWCAMRGGRREGEGCEGGGGRVRDVRVGGGRVRDVRVGGGRVRERGVGGGR